MTFDPRKYREHQQSQSGGGTPGAQRERDDRPIPAGEYLLALVWFKTGFDRNGFPLLNCRFEICWGPGKGRGFWSRVSLNLRKPGAAGRVASWCECVGDTSALDERSAKAIADRFKNRVFLARVSSRRGDTRTFNDIERFIVEMSDEQIRAADAWESEKRAELEARKGQARPEATADWYEDAPRKQRDEWNDGWDDAPMPGDEHAPPARGGGGERRARSRAAEPVGLDGEAEPNDPLNDDIPF